MDVSRELLNTIIVDVFRDVLQLQEKVLQDNGITLSITEVHTLEAIQNLKENNKMSDVAQNLNITASTLSININRLVKKGYVVKERDKVDRRITHLILTPQALEVLSIHDKFHQELIDSFLIDLKINEDKVFLESLARIEKHLSNLKTKTFLYK